MTLLPGGGATAAAAAHDEPEVILRERRLVRVLAMIQFLHILDFVIMMPMGPQFMRVFDISATQFGWLVSAYTLAASAAGFFWAPLMDRFDRKRTLGLLFLGFLLGTFACSQAWNFWALLGARAVAGAFGGVLSGVSFSIIGDMVHQTRRGTATGAVMASFSLASVFGVPFSLYLASAIDWHAPFTGIVVFGIFASLALWRWVPSVRGHIEGETTPWLAQVRAVFGEENHRRSFLLTGVLMFAGFSVIPFLSTYLVQNTGFPELRLPWMYLAGGSVTFFTSRFIGRLADRHGAYRVFRVLALLSIVPILAATHLPTLPIALVLVVTTVFMSLVSGRFVPAMTLVNGATVMRLRGSFLSFNSALQSLASGLAATLAGTLITTRSDGSLEGYGTVGWIAVGATLLCLPLARRIGQRS